MTDHALPQAPRILVIRRDNIGDLACTTPMIRALRTRFPRGHIAVLVNSYNRPVVENNPDLDAVYDYTKGKHRLAGENLLGVLWRRARLLWSLRQQRFDCAIIAGAHFLPRALGLARFIKPRHLVGFTEAGKPGVEHIDWGVPYTLPQPLHEAEDVFRLLAPFGIHGRPPAMCVYPGAAALAHARAALAPLPNGAGPLIAVHISARKPTNRWPAERFAELMQRLHAGHGARFVLFWSPGSASNPRHPGDDEKAQSIIERVRALPVQAFPTERLDELIAGLALCDAVICSDGGAMHLAAALGKPIVCFFGKSDRTRWYPWEVPHVLLQPTSENVADVGVEQAVTAYVEVTTKAKTNAGK